MCHILYYIIMNIEYFSYFKEKLTSYHPHKMDIFLKTRFIVNNMVHNARVLFWLSHYILEKIKRGADNFKDHGENWTIWNDVMRSCQAFLPAE